MAHAPKSLLPRGARPQREESRERFRKRRAIAFFRLYFSNLCNPMDPFGEFSPYSSSVLRGALRQPASGVPQVWGERARRQGAGQMRASALCIRGNTLKQTMRWGPACPQRRGRFPNAGCAPGNVPDAGELPPPGLGPSNPVKRAAAFARAERGTAPDDPDSGAPRPRAQKRSPGGRRPWASGTFQEVRERARVRAKEIAMPAAPGRLRTNRQQARPARASPRAGPRGRACVSRLRR